MKTARRNTLFRVLLISVLALGAAAAAHADHGRRDYGGPRHERRWDDGYDRRDWRADHRDWRQDRRAWRGDRWQGRHRDRVVVLPPRSNGFRPVPPPPGWHPGWRESWRHGYRYWAGDRYWFVAPGRPAVELSLVFPLY